MMTSEERLRWLRGRGVQVQRQSQQSDTSCRALCHFTYVFVPADPVLPAEERIALTDGAGDVLPDLLSQEFAGTVDDATLLHSAKAHKQEIGLPALRAAAAHGGADRFRLAAPSAENGREAVNAYLDDCASLKGLPRNERATALARACGFPVECELPGNIFVGRVQWAEEGLRNLDFTLHDLDPTSLWQRRAPLENLLFQQETQPEELATAQESAWLRPEQGRGSGEQYTWQDSEEDIEVTVYFEEVRKQDVRIAFKRRAVELKMPMELRLELYADVELQACTWTCCEEGIRITLPKCQERSWPQLLRT